MLNLVLNKLYTWCQVGYLATGVLLIDSPLWIWNEGECRGFKFRILGLECYIITDSHMGKIDISHTGPLRYHHSTTIIAKL